MASILAQLNGLVPGQHLSTEAAVRLVQRLSKLSYRQAKVLVLDFRGFSYEQIGEELKVDPETARTYWKRGRKKYHWESKEEAYAWVENLLRKELEE
jgi:DNA-directed RNA polymerase specialized sigma24 family protein